MREVQILSSIRRENWVIGTFL